jgi:hypothetical protein
METKKILIGIEKSEIFIMLHYLVFSKAIVGLLKPSKRSEPDSESFLVGRDIYLL